MNSKSKPVVIHIDDSVIVTMAVQHQLEALGWTVHSFNSTIGVINRVLDLKPDVFLLDVKLPDLDGNNYVGVLKGSNRLKDVPVLFYSNLTHEELSDLVEFSKADGFISKTNDGVELDRQLRQWLR